jgi:hypothetical protein
VVRIRNCIVILTPLSFFRKTRKIAAFGFTACSYIFGFCTWVLGLLTAYFYWSIMGIIIGFFFAGVGVVPIGILAALFNADWYAVVVPFDGMVFTFGARGIALWLAHMVDRAEEKRLKIIAVEIAR